MAGFRFIHTADLHLDSPFKGIGGRAPESVFRRLRDSTLTAFDRVVRLCIEERVDFLCIAGDVFDLADRSLRAQTYFQKQMMELEGAGIQVFVIHGNHDPMDGGIMPLQWPDNVHFFSAEQVESVPFRRDGRELARIYGRSYPTSKFTERIVQHYRRDLEVPFAIGLLHTNLGGDPSHDNYAPCSKSELLAQNFDYWALGHIHEAAVIQEHEPCIVYAGNTQGRSVKESGAKGCYLIEVEGSEVTSLTFHETDDVRWHEIELDVTGVGDVQHVLDRIQETFEGIVVGSPGRASVVRIHLTGMTSVHDDLKQAEHVMELMEPYLEEWLQRENWLFVESLHVRTKPLISRETLLEGEGFLGDYLRLVEEITEQPEQFATLKNDVLDEVFAHREARKHLEQLTDEQVRQLLDEASDLAVRLLHK